MSVCPPARGTIGSAVPWMASTETGLLSRQGTSWALPVAVAMLPETGAMAATREDSSHPMRRARSMPAAHMATLGTAGAFESAPADVLSTNVADTQASVGRRKVAPGEDVERVRERNHDSQTQHHQIGGGQPAGEYVGGLEVMEKRVRLPGLGLVPKATQDFEEVVGYQEAQGQGDSRSVPVAGG